MGQTTSHRTFFRAILKPSASSSAKLEWSDEFSIGGGGQMIRWAYENGAKLTPDWFVNQILLGGEALKRAA